VVRFNAHQQGIYMIRKFCLLMALLSPLAGVAAEAVLKMGGTLKVTAPAFDLSGSLYTAGWKKSVSGRGFTPPDAQGNCLFELPVDDQTKVSGSVSVKKVDADTIHAAYCLTPESDMTLNALMVGFRLPVEKLAGASWKTDTKEGVFPAVYGSSSVFSGRVRRLEVNLAPPQTEHLVLTFDEPTPVLIQDDRKWGDTFSFRLGNNGEKKYAAGVPLKVAFTVAVHEPLTVVYDLPVTIQAGKEWLPLTYEKEIEPGSALDFSGMGFTDGPAGKYGWLLAKGAHFEFEKMPGVNQRFCGVNFCNTANFPSPDQAEQLADRLQRLGYNSIRLHHYDNGCVQGSGDGLTLNAGQMEKIDALAAACIKRGIYITTDLFVSRKITWRQIGIERDDAMDKQIFKALVAVHEPAFQNWAAFARAFLNHVNPHTGRRYADEPGMPFIAMINEGPLAFSIKESSQLKPMQAAWEQWLKTRRASDKAFDDIPDEMPRGYGGRAGSALALFSADIESRMVTRMKSLLRDELGCRALITDLNCGPHYASMQPVRDTQYDYVDNHFYVDHPQFMAQRWHLPSRSTNQNPIRSIYSGPGPVAFVRVFDKPFTVSEYNYSAPGMFRGVGGILTGAMGSLQDWSALWRFTYSHSLERMFDGNGAIGYFDLASDPLAQATERASLCLFLRGDLAPATQKISIHLPASEVSVLRDEVTRVRPDWSWLAWSVQVGTHSSGPGVASGRNIEFKDAYTPETAVSLGVLTNTPGALVMDRARGSFTIDTARTCGGFVEAGEIDAGALNVRISGSPATVWVSVLDKEPVATSSRLLLTHLTDVQNTGVKFAGRARQILLAHGGLPPLVREGQARVALSLDAPAAYSVYALATSGRRVQKMESSVAAGKLVFTAAVDGGAEGARMLYEIVRE